MVRNIIGSLVYIGKENHPPEWIEKILVGRDRAFAAPTFSAAGLYLGGINYDPEWGLPSFIEPPFAAVLPRMSRGE